jgi:GNAT superfamily N-acetyltransferase
MELLHISNSKDGKILYVLSDAENEINPYFYANPENITDEEIGNEFEEIISEENEIDTPVKLGHITIAIEDSDTWLDHIEVLKTYQGNGIGTNLVNLAIQHLNVTHIACVMESGEYTYELTGAGEKLIASCIRKNIVTENMCVFSGDDRLLLTGDTSDDPGYNSEIVRAALGITISKQGNQWSTSYSDSEEAFSEDDESEYNQERVPVFEDTMPSNLSALLTSTSLLFEPTPDLEPLAALQEFLLASKNTHQSIKK